MFLSTTAGGVLPVTTVDGVPVGSGAVGPITEKLRERYWRKQEAGWHGTKVDYQQGSARRDKM